jgi:hypothetical protein
MASYMFCYFHYIQFDVLSLVLDHTKNVNHLAHHCALKKKSVVLVQLFIENAG